MKVFLVVLLLTACRDDALSQCQPCPDGGGDVDACCLNGNVDAVLDALFICDPVQQTGCADGLACYSDLYVDPQAQYVCATPGTGTEAANCTVNTDCAMGYWCVKGRLNKCTRYCDSAAQCSTTSPTCAHDPSMEYPFGYCACVTNPGIGTCP